MYFFWYAILSSMYNFVQHMHLHKLFSTNWMQFCNLPPPAGYIVVCILWLESCIDRFGEVNISKKRCTLIHMLVENSENGISTSRCELNEFLCSPYSISQNASKWCYIKCHSQGLSRASGKQEVTSPLSQNETPGCYYISHRPIIRGKLCNSFSQRGITGKKM